MDDFMLGFLAATVCAAIMAAFWGLLPDDNIVVEAKKPPQQEVALIKATEIDVAYALKQVRAAADLLDQLDWSDCRETAARRQRPIVSSEPSMLLREQR